MILRFGDLFLDESKLELRRGSERIHMQGKALQVLCELATKSGKTVSNEELLRTVWRNETVAAGSIKRAVRIARKALGDDGESQRTIRTVRGHGYRFVLPVTVADETALGLSAPDLPPVAAPPRSACASDGAFAPRPLIGRRNALAIVDEQLREALGARARCVLLIGPAGIGKTALLRQVVHRASKMGANTWFARCAKEQGSPSFWPWIQLMRSCNTSRGTNELEQHIDATEFHRGSRISPVRDWLGGVGGVPVNTDPEAQFRFFDAITEFLDDAARRRPVVLLFDDLHHADAPTLTLLSFVTRQLDATRLMVALAMRPLAVHGPRAGPLEQFMRDVPVTCLELHGLQLDDVREFIDVGTGKRAPDAVVHRLLELTGGNPLLLQHLLSGWALSDPQKDAIDWERFIVRSKATGTTCVISRVLSDLDDSLQRLLSLASILGTEFTLDRLASLAGCDAAVLLQPLTTAVATGIVRNVPSTRLTYRFVHVLVRDAMCAALPIDERLHLQQRADGMPNDDPLSTSDRTTNFGEVPRRKDVVWQPFAG